MTELETLMRAKMYVDKLANGVNPLTDEPVLESDVVNNVRISRCLFYVSSVLSKVIENGGEIKQVTDSREAFQADFGKIRNIEYSDAPIGIAELSNRISFCKANENMKNLSHGRITGWLVNQGLLKLVNDGNGKSIKRPTQAGQAIGIFTEIRNGYQGMYEAVLYTLSAQHFIVDNLEAILKS